MSDCYYGIYVSADQLTNLKVNLFLSKFVNKYIKKYLNKVYVLELPQNRSNNQKA